MADGRSVVTVRVRAIADGGAANAAVIQLLAKSLGVPKTSVRLLSGATSRRKQIAVDGDPRALLTALRALSGTTKDKAKGDDDGADH